MEHPGLDFHGETDLSQCKMPSLSSYMCPDVNTVRRLLSSLGQARSTSDSGTGLVAIAKPPGTVA
jgi:hypothetical protein